MKTTHRQIITDWNWIISKTKTKPNIKICINSTSSHHNKTTNFPNSIIIYLTIYHTKLQFLLFYLSFSLSLFFFILFTKLSIAMEDISDEECNTGLYLGLGIKKEKKKQKLVNKPCFDLAFELCPKNEAIKVHNSHINNNNKGERFSLEYYPNATTCSTDSDNNNADRRKKLRLTKEQSAMLENTFKLHNTLNPVRPPISSTTSSICNPELWV